MGKYKYALFTRNCVMNNLYFSYTSIGGFMSKIGYARCSTAEQNPQRQQEWLQSQGCERIYLDMLSGKDTNRPQLQAMLDYVREGDVLFVESISRLARSTRDLLSIVDQLTENGVQFISQKESIDTETPQGKFMLTVFAAMAELERDQIRQRQREGIAIAQREGRYKGGQKKHVDQYLFEELYKQWENGIIKQKYMCDKLHISRKTLYSRIQEYEANH